MNEPTTRSELRENRERLTLFLFTIGFWNYALERLVWTFAQTFTAVGFYGGVALHDIPWMFAASSALGAAFLSFLKSVILYARAPEDAPDDAEPTEGNG